MSPSMNQKQTHRHREQTYGCQGGVGVEPGRTESSGFTDANYYMQDGKTKKACSIVQGSICNTL